MERPVRVGQIKKILTLLQQRSSFDSLYVQGDGQSCFEINFIVDYLIKALLLKLNFSCSSGVKIKCL